jgi:hypothetical protein
MPPAVLVTKPPILVKRKIANQMTPETFFTMGYLMSTQTYASRGGPQPSGDGKRARYERFEVGPYEARFGIIGEIKEQPLGSHDLVFEIFFGSHSVSARRTIINKTSNPRIREHAWVNAPSDADRVTLFFLWGEV